MDTTELHRMCGISPMPAKKVEGWVKTEMRFIGAERYVLCTQYVAVKFVSTAKGLSLVIKGPKQIPADMLLGKKSVEGKLYDIELCTAGLTTSLAALRPASYPKMLRKGGTVQLTT